VFGRLAILLVFTVPLCTVSISVARAQAADATDGSASEPISTEDAAPNNESRAREAFVLGSRAFDDRRWDDAARYFGRAYELSNQPELLFNIGAARERLGDRSRAIEAFERYLDAAPDADNRSEVEERLHTLRAGIGEVPDGSSGVADDAPAEGRDGGSGPLPWLVVATGAVAGGAGAVLLALANASKDRVESAPSGTYWDEVAGDAAEARSFSIAAAILLGIGGAALAGGLLWVLLDGESKAGGVAIAPTGVAAWGSF
jgi:tetratricopeptide (TPR) repeat protein